MRISDFIWNFGKIHSFIWNTVFVVRITFLMLVYNYYSSLYAAFYHIPMPLSNIHVISLFFRSVVNFLFHILFGLLCCLLPFPGFDSYATSWDLGILSRHLYCQLPSSLFPRLAHFISQCSESSWFRVVRQMMAATVACKSVWNLLVSCPGILLELWNFRFNHLLSSTLVAVDALCSAQGGTKKQKYDKISEKKMSTPIEVLCKVRMLSNCK